jgi:hypothetical protein
MGRLWGFSRGLVGVCHDNYMFPVMSGKCRRRRVTNKKSPSCKGKTALAATLVAGRRQRAPLHAHSCTAENATRPISSRDGPVSHLHHSLSFTSHRHPSFQKPSGSHPVLADQHPASRNLSTTRPTPQPGRSTDAKDAVGRCEHAYIMSVSPRCTEPATLKSPPIAMHPLRRFFRWRAASAAKLPGADDVPRHRHRRIHHREKRYDALPLGGNCPISTSPPSMTSGGHSRCRRRRHSPSTSFEAAAARHRPRHALAAAGAVATRVGTLQQGAHRHTADRAVPQHARVRRVPPPLTVTPATDEREHEEHATDGVVSLAWAACLAVNAANDVCGYHQPRPRRPPCRSNRRTAMQPTVLCPMTSVPAHEDVFEMPTSFDTALMVTTAG